MDLFDKRDTPGGRQRRRQSSNVHAQTSEEKGWDQLRQMVPGLSIEPADETAAFEDTREYWRKLLDRPAPEPDWPEPVDIQGFNAATALENAVRLQYMQDQKEMEEQVALVERSKRTRFPRDIDWPEPPAPEDEDFLAPGWSEMHQRRMEFPVPPGAPGPFERRREKPIIEYRTPKDEYEEWMDDRTRMPEEWQGVTKQRRR